MMMMLGSLKSLRPEKLSPRPMVEASAFDIVPPQREHTLESGGGGSLPFGGVPKPTYSAARKVFGKIWEGSREIPPSPVDS